MKFLKTPQFLVLSIYLIINIYFGILIYEKGSLWGEVNQILYSGNIMLVCFAVVCLYVYFNWILYCYAYRRLDGYILKAQCAYGVGLDFFILASQIVFLMYFYTNGLYSAGSSIRDDSWVSYFWVLFPVDMLFFIYYGYQRNSPIFKYNLTVALISSIIRGWSGILLTVVYMEFSRYSTKNGINRIFLLALLAASLLAYPFVLNAKFEIRKYSLGEVESSEIVYDLVNMSNLDPSYLISLKLSTEQLLSRIQIVSHAAAITENIEFFRSQLDADIIYPFWLEGIHGLASDILIGNEKRLSFTNSIAQFIDGGVTNIVWNVNPSVLGWMELDGFFGVPTLFYITLLCLLSAKISSLLPNTIDTKAMVWYAWLVYINPGWLAAFILFIYSQFIFYMLCVLFKKKTVPVSKCLSVFD